MTRAQRYTCAMRVFGLRFLCASLLLVAASAGGETTDSLFGIIPQYSPQESARQWQPLLESLAAETNIPLRFATASRISRFEERVFAGDYDFVYLNPVMYREAQRRLGYRALARDESTTRGILVARQTGPTSLAQLADKGIAFPAPTAVAALMIRIDLKAAGVPYQYAYLGTHESVYRAVAAGQYVAGAGVGHTFEQLPAAIRQQLRVMYQTEPFVSHVIAVHPRVAAADAARMQRALLALHTREPTRTLMRSVGFERLVPVAAPDLASVAHVAYPKPTRRMTLHVIPRLSEADTRLHMLPLTAYVRQRLEIEMALATYPDMARFERALESEAAPALVNANPTQALDLIRRGYRAIAQQLTTEQAAGVEAVIVVALDSPYRTIADLRGARVAFGGGPNAFFASIVPRVMLKRAGLHGQYQDVSAPTPGPVAHVLQQLGAGAVDAIAIGTPAFQNRRLREQYIDGRMRVLARSGPLPGLAWLVSPAVDADTREALRYLLLNFGTDAPGHAELAASGTDRLVAASNATYAPVAQYLKDLAEP